MPTAPSCPASPPAICGVGFIGGGGQLGDVGINPYNQIKGRTEGKRLILDDQVGEKRAALQIELNLSEGNVKDQGLILDITLTSIQFNLKYRFPLSHLLIQSTQKN